MASDAGGCVLLVMDIFHMTYDDLIRHLRFMVLDRYNCNEEAKDKLMKTAAYAIEELQREREELLEKLDKGMDNDKEDDFRVGAEELDYIDTAIDEAMRESNK